MNKRSRFLSSCSEIFMDNFVSQPYGIGGTIRYLRQFIGASPEEQKALLKDPRLLHIYQAQFIGFQYFCNKCMAVCPACIET